MANDCLSVLENQCLDDVSALQVTLLEYQNFGAGGSCLQLVASRRRERKERGCLGCPLVSGRPKQPHLIASCFGALSIAGCNHS